MARDERNRSRFRDKSHRLKRALRLRGQARRQWCKHVNQEIFSQNDKGTVWSAAVPSPDSVLDQLRLAIKGIRYGEIRVIIQDYVIVQIERVEKQRLR